MHGDIVYCVSWIRITTDTLNTRFTNYPLYCKIVVVTDVLEYYPEYIMTFITN